MYVIVWAFEPHPAAVPEFERMYGPDGEWARLFAGGAGFQGTALLRDAERPGAYLTIDRWDTAGAYDVFRLTHATAYAALDARGEGLTRSERLIGHYETERQ